MGMIFTLTRLPQSYASLSLQSKKVEAMERIYLIYYIISCSFKTFQVLNNNINWISKRFQVIWLYISVEPRQSLLAIESGNWFHLGEKRKSCGHARRVDKLLKKYGKNGAIWLVGLYSSFSPERRYIPIYRKYQPIAKRQNRLENL